MVDPQEQAGLLRQPLAVSHGRRSASAFGVFVAYSIAQLQIRVRAVFLLWALDVSTPRRDYLLSAQPDPVFKFFPVPDQFALLPAHTPSRQVRRIVRF